MDEILKRELVISVAKAAMGAIPWFGPSLNEVFFDYRSRVKQERINTFLADLMEQLEHYETGGEDFEHLRSDALGDFFESVIRKVAENRSSDMISKIRSHIFSSCAIGWIYEYSIFLLPCYGYIAPQPERF